MIRAAYQNDFQLQWHRRHSDGERARLIKRNPVKTLAVNDIFQPHPQQRLRQQCTQRDDENTAICLMHQTWLQGNVAIKLAQAAKELFRFYPVGSDNLR